MDRIYTVTIIFKGEIEMKTFRKIWNTIALPFFMIGTMMTILKNTVNFSRDDSRKKFKACETIVWIFQNIGALLFNVTEFFYD